MSIGNAAVVAPDWTAQALYPNLTIDGAGANATQMSIGKSQVYFVFLLIFGFFFQKKTNVIHNII